MTTKPRSTLGPPAHASEPNQYRDRPTDDGKHGDAAQEPNSGMPASSNDAPGRPKPASSRQQTHVDQVSQTGSPALDAQHSEHKKPPKRGR